MIIGDSPRDDSLGQPAQPTGRQPTGSKQPAPPPKVHKGPPKPVRPHTWNVPHHDADADRLSVHTSALREVGGAMMGQDMYDLDGAVRDLGPASQGFGSLQGWSTGMSFYGNVSAAREGFIAATGQAGDAHASAAKKLEDTAGSYDEAEQQNKHSVNRSHSGNNGHQGS
jgi:hypothetical protein